MASSSSLMASQTLILQNPAFLFPLHKTTARSLPFSPPKPLNFSKTPTLSFSNFKPYTKTPRVPKIFASSSTIPTHPSINSSNTQTPDHSVLTDSTRTITTLLAITLSVSRLFAQKIGNFALKLKGICASPSPDELLSIQGIQDTVVCTMGPLFFAALRSRRPAGSLNTPLTVVAAGMSKWLAIYNGVLLVRVLLSWFPNIPWDRQPLSAIRDLCDPYLNLFRNIIPPLFDTLDISPLMAFAVLGVLSSILTSSTRY